MPGDDLDAVNDVDYPETKEPDEPPVTPVMPPAPPFPTFLSKPTLPHQAPGNGYESGRDSRAR